MALATRAEVPAASIPRTVGGGKRRGFESSSLRVFESFESSSLTVAQSRPIDELLRACETMRLLDDLTTGRLEAPRPSMRIAFPKHEQRHARGKVDQRLGQLLSKFGGRADEIGTRARD
jgi:hypothetical protein